MCSYSSQLSTVATRIDCSDIKGVVNFQVGLQCMYVLRNIGVDIVQVLYVYTKSCYLRPSHVSVHYLVPTYLD